MGKGDGVQLVRLSKAISSRRWPALSLDSVMADFIMDAAIMLLHPPIEIHTRSVLFQQISRCECALGDALEWHLLVGKTPAGSTAALSSANRTVASKSNGELFTDTVQYNNGDNPTSSTPPLWNIPPRTKGTGLQQ
jgi:hypothetical protein